MQPTTDEAPTTPVVGNARRRFLFTGGAMLAGGLVVAACGDDEEESEDPTTTTAGGEEETTTTSPPEEMPPEGGDVATAMFAASLEVLAVNTYQAALDAATGGMLGEVPPAVAEFVTVALADHQMALDTWNGVITGAGGEEVTEPPAELEATVNEAFGQVTDVTGAAELALMLEQIAGATYLSAIPALMDPAAITLAGQLDYVDQQHAAVLLFVLGQYPVPEVFQSTTKAAS